MSKPVEILLEKYYELGGKLFGQFMIRNKGDDETQKALKANDFLMGMMNGDFKKEWKVETTEEYKAMVEIADAINTLHDMERVRS